MGNNLATRKSAIFVTFVLGLIGITCLIIGIQSKADRNQKKSSYQTTVGTIIGSESNSKKSSQINHTRGKTRAPIYRYEVNGQTYTIKDKIFTNSNIEIGKEVKIYYNPANPQDAFADTPAHLGNLLILLAVLFLSITALVITMNIPISDAKKTIFEGLIVCVMFIGFPIALMRMLPDLVLILKILLSIMILIGVYAGALLIYKVFFKQDFQPNQGDINTKVSDFVANVESNPTIQNVMRWVRIAGMIVPIVILIIYVGVMVFSIRNGPTERITKSDDGRTILTEDIIAYSLNQKTSDVPKHFVCERTVVAISGNQVYFEATPGLEYSCITNEHFDIGEKVLWVEYYENEKNMVVSENEYVYTGDKTPASTSLFDKDGKCIINDAFVKRYFHTSSWEVVSVEFVRMEDNKLHFKEKEGSSYALTIPQELCRYYENAKAGDEYYYFRFDDSAYALDADEYVYYD